MVTASPAYPMPPSYPLAATTEAVSRTLAWPWVVAVVVLVAVAAAVVVWLRMRREAAARRDRLTAQDATWVAHTARVTHLPAFRTWLRRYRALQWTGIGLLAVSVVATGVLAARPVNVQVKQSVLGTRDIVLCLDVSGSMLEYDQQMVDIFRDLVKGFDGERIALSVFNRTSRTVFPLTDDYDLVDAELDEASAALDPVVLATSDQTIIERYLTFTAGTTSANSDASSLIGDGLANCALQFDDGASGASGDASDGGATSAPAAEKRSRSIILATDNDLRGTPVYTLPQAVALASSLDVEIDALYGASSYVTDPSIETSYRDAVEAADGHFYAADDPSAVADIVQRVQTQQAVALDAAPEVTKSDRPRGWFVVLLLATVGLVLTQWRLRE